MRPNARNSIQIAHPGDKAPQALPFEKWADGPLGPGFSYEDFFESQYYWPTQTVQSKTKFGARLCDLLTSKPSPPTAHITPKCNLGWTTASAIRYM